MVISGSSSGGGSFYASVSWWISRSAGSDRWNASSSWTAMDSRNCPEENVGDPLVVLLIQLELQGFVQRLRDAKVGVRTVVNMEYLTVADLQVLGLEELGAAADGEPNREAVRLLVEGHHLARGAVVGFRSEAVQGDRRECSKEECVAILVVVSGEVGGGHA